VNFATNAIASKIKHRLESKITSSVPPVPVAAPCSEQHPVKNPFTKLHVIQRWKPRKEQTVKNYH
jgi:hypothetical protein